MIQKAVDFGALFGRGSSSANQIKNTLTIKFFDDQSVVTLPEIRQRDYTFRIGAVGSLPLISVLNDNQHHKQRRYFLSYGDSRFEQALRRICAEAEKSQYFDTIVGLSRQNLGYEFLSTFHEVLQMQRGGGYWIWKPFIIKRQLDAMNENDILVYCDSGCTVNANGAQQYENLIHLVNESKFGIIGFD